MAVRTSSKTITFLRPFMLSGVDEQQPAGNYVVETDEELIPFLSFSAYRRIATWLTLAAGSGGKGRVETAMVDPAELEALQVQDAKSGTGRRQFRRPGASAGSAAPVFHEADATAHRLRLFSRGGRV